MKEEDAVQRRGPEVLVGVPYESVAKRYGAHVQDEPASLQTLTRQQL